MITGTYWLHWCTRCDRRFWIHISPHHQACVCVCVCVRVCVCVFIKPVLNGVVWPPVIRVFCLSYLCWADLMLSLSALHLMEAARSVSGLRKITIKPKIYPQQQQQRVRADAPRVCAGNQEHRLRRLRWAEWKFFSRKELKLPVKRLFRGAARSFFTRSFTLTSCVNSRWSEAMWEYLQRRLLPVTSSP